MIDFTAMQLPVPGSDYQWQRLQRWAIICWLAFYLLFLLHAYHQHGGQTWFDAANLVTHESGHLLFGYLGNETIMVWGGTIMQLLVPFLLATSFAWRGQTAGVIFCSFFFFENFIGIALYMADARARNLPLVSPGMASDEITGHDWNYIFSHLGLLAYDTRIADVVRIAGWLGMLGVVGVLVWMLAQQEQMVEEVTP